ncbi:membrane protein insertion efficiency factor YidD [Anditalea andensis]|uniref:Membrane protein insertion efficiency factor YidD n=1 Tax=Anditalea andensis TaxID=1048983 RepID=A0A074LKU8_9BACT|nr:membrane protein insertion efficiency factor YidD [Anditalea andensis]KEO74467.1 hypothetical protein EL17_06940 [Anditalea andensis]
MNSVKIIFLLWIAFIHPIASYAQDESVKDLFGFYQAFISDIRGGKCPMYPSCSKYAISAIQNKGALTGLLYTTDRLMRCGHEHKIYSRAYINGEVKLLDPVMASQLDSIDIKTAPQRFGKNLNFYREKNDTTFFLHLINKGLYAAAISEYQRIKHYGGVTSTSLILEYNYYSSLSALGEYEKILYDYQFELHPSLKNEPLILLEVGETWFHLDNFEKALETVESIPSPTKYDDHTKLFKGLVHAHAANYESAMEEFSHISPEFIYSDYAQHNKRIVNELANLKRKSKTAAGLASIIPGGGYLYTGHKTTAVSSLVLTGLLTYASYTSFNTGNYGMGVLTGIFSMSFYISNITGGIKSADRYNKAKESQLKRKLMYSFNK